MNTPEQARLWLFATPGYPCSYIAGREATTLFVDSGAPKDPALYTLLSRAGFRRSGAHIYRPECRRCQECIPVRVPVARFRPRRIHRRVRAANRDLTLRVLPARFEPAHFALYRRYLSARHAGGGMDDPSPAEYRDFLISPWCDTLFFEYSLGGVVLAVSVIDRLADALSCVYTFFDPAHGRRSLGTYANPARDRRGASGFARLAVPRLLRRRRPQDALQGRLPPAGAVCRWTVDDGRMNTAPRTRHSRNHTPVGQRIFVVSSKISRIRG